jgi:hypothetical protein
MPKTVLSLVAVGAAALLVAGCGSDTGGAHTLPAKAQSPSAAVSTVSTISNAPACAASAEVTVTAADSGHEVCVKTGGRVTVQLAAGWAPVTASGAALAKASGTEFNGAKAGRAELTSSERVCPKPTGKGMMGCGALRGWRVTVVVR